MKLACVASYICHPKILPIYVEYSGASSSDEYRDPSHFISVAMNHTGGTASTIPQCLRLLESRDQYVFFIADEVDQVYNSRDDESKRLNILGDLAELGSQKSGRVFTFLCSSASVTPQLISKNGVHYPDIVDEYPLLRNCPNLNRSKFSSLQLSSGILENEDLRAAVKAFGLNASDEAVNLLYFLAGNNLREMVKIADDISRPSTADSGAPFATDFPDSFFPPGMWDARIDKVSTKQRSVIHGLSMALSKKNYSLISAAVRDLDSVRTIPWVSAMKPLTHEEVLAVLLRTHPSDRAEGLHAVNQLVDKGFFSAPPSLKILLPSKPLDLLHFYSTYQRERQSWWKSWLINAAGEKATPATREALCEQAVRISVASLLKYCL